MSDRIDQALVERLRKVQAGRPRLSRAELLVAETVLKAAGIDIGALHADWAHDILAEEERGR